MDISISNHQNRGASRITKTNNMTQKGSYKGKPTLSLFNEGQERFPFTFGVAKARLIIENFGAIQKFVADHEPKTGDRFDMDNEDRGAERIGLAGGGQ